MNNKNRILSEKKFSLAHLTLIEQPIFELIKIAEGAKYDYLSPRLLSVTEKEEQHKFIGNKKIIQNCKSLLNDSNVKVLDVELLSINEKSNIVNEFEPMLEAAAELNALYAITQIHTESLSIAEKKFEQLGVLAKKYNIELILEILPWSELSSLQKTVNFLEKTNQTNTGILFDLLHMYRIDLQPEILSNIDSKYFKFVHLCDARGEGINNLRDQKHIAREARYPAGRGDIPVLNYLEQMPVHTYSLEVPNERLHRHLGPQEYASYVLEDTKNYLLLEACWRVKSQYISVPEKII